MKETKLSLSVQYATKKEEDIPKRSQVRSWVRSACLGVDKTADITIRFVDENESKRLNSHYRKKHMATNVLSFDYSENNYFILGDIIICSAIIREESIRYQKPLLARYAHIIVHGVLHLLGYRHDMKSDEKKMEEQEQNILARLGFSDPYI